MYVIKEIFYLSANKKRTKNIIKNERKWVVTTLPVYGK